MSNVNYKPTNRILKKEMVELQGQYKIDYRGELCKSPPINVDDSDFRALLSDRRLRRIKYIENLPFIAANFHTIEAYEKINKYYTNNAVETAIEIQVRDYKWNDNCYYFIPDLIQINRVKVKGKEFLDRVIVFNFISPVGNVKKIHGLSWDTYKKPNVEKLRESTNSESYLNVRTEESGTSTVYLEEFKSEKVFQSIADFLENPEYLEDLKLFVYDANNIKVCATIPITFLDAFCNVEFSNLISYGQTGATSYLRKDKDSELENILRKYSTDDIKKISEKLNSEKQIAKPKP